MTFTKEQENLVRKQLAAHLREPGIKAIHLDEDTTLEFLVEKGVFGSDLLGGAIHLARFLHTHPNLYAGRDALDMGCGPGTQGLGMVRNGAKHVTFSDINPKAVDNTNKNVHNYRNVEVYESDLFSQLPRKKYDVIVFNHPFFPGNADDFKEDPTNDLLLRKSMLGGTELIKIFFQQASSYLNDEGKIIMPFFHFAGIDNDPANHVGAYGFRIEEHYKINSDKGFHRGNISIYVITK
jgi:methylase of polypeptide subunit release factors